MKVYGESLREFQGLPVTRQIMVLASQWTAGVDSFQKAFQPDPVLVFASRLEAAVQGKVQQVSVMFFLMMCLSFGLSFLLHSPSPTLPLLLLSFISSSTPLLFHYQLFHPTSPSLSALPPHVSFLISSSTPLLFHYQLFHPTSPSLSALQPHFFLISSSTPPLLPYQFFHPTSPSLSVLPPHFSFLISSSTPLLLSYQLFLPTSPSLSALPPHFSFLISSSTPLLLPYQLSHPTSPSPFVAAIPS